jgi:hypothetical protein
MSARLPAPASRAAVPAGRHPARPTSRGLRGTAAVLLAAVLLAGCSAEADEARPMAAATTEAPEPTETPAPLPSPELAEPVDVAAVTSTATPQTALATVPLLEVKGRAPKTGYSRDAFGAAWADVDRNGCDTRNDILARDLTDVTYKDGTKDCVVLTGTFADPYSRTTIAFERGEKTSTAVQIDHVVALSDAWQKGAQGWDEAKRTAFANDPLNLWAADGPLNGQKSDGDTATWLPPNKDFRCEYVARQVGVKFTYGLWVTDAEQVAMASVLSTCPDQPLPEGSAVPEIPAPEPAPEPEPTTAPPAPAPAPAPAVEPAPAPVVEQAPAPAPEPVVVPEPAPAPVGVYYENCDAARAAGAAPVYRGDPGYAKKLDRDGDGVGCE